MSFRTGLSPPFPKLQILGLYGPVWMMPTGALPKWRRANFLASELAGKFLPPRGRQNHCRWQQVTKKLVGILKFGCDPNACSPHRSTPKNWQGSRGHPSKQPLIVQIHVCFTIQALHYLFLKVKTSSNLFILQKNVQIADRCIDTERSSRNTCTQAVFCNNFITCRKCK